MNVHSTFGGVLSGARRAVARDVALLGLATARAPHILPQLRVIERAGSLLGPRFADFERLSGVFENAGIEERQSVVPFEWFDEPRDWEERSRAYVEGAGDLFERAALAAMEAAGLEARQVDCIVTATTTGISTPTLEARAAMRLGFRPDVRRVPIFGLGCAGGVTGLATAARMARALPGSNVLFVTVEACTLSFRLDRVTKADIVATALFGDGAAAAALRAGAAEGEAGALIGEGVEHTWPDTLFIMGWNVERDGLGVVFDRSIPPFVHENYRVAAEEALLRMDLSRSDVDRLVCHPGGAKVVDAIEAAMTLPSGSLDAEREVLRRHGNMSAPTVLFVLDEVLRRGSRGNLVLASLGPGFTASFLPLSTEG